MSSLDKLAIRGIRSFDNNKSSVVDFQSPVTVIVGSNGTGKTTVIECLKYCTTGELPPNTKGGAFVHDPKLAGENEVKAQVKLRFQNTNGERMVVTRNLQVTAKKTGLSMKTLEGVLAKDENEGGNHKRNTISTKCSEIDSEVPRLLGVSKAILDNVIFCHQEESNWPLSEPAPLKKKFDEIFEATRFTDALDSIKKIRKENMAELKVEKEKLNHLRLEKDRSETIKVKLAKIDTQIANQQQTADDTGERANDLARVNVEFREKAGEFMAIFDKVKNLEHEISVWDEQIVSYEDSMTLLKESEEELRAKVQSFGRTLEEKKRRSQETQNKKSDEMEGLRALERELSGLVQSRGQVLGEKKMHETAIKEREEIAKVLCASYELKGYDYSPLEKVKIDEILDKLKDVKKKKDNMIRQMKIDSKSAEEAIRVKLNALTAAKATEVGERTGLQKQLSELERLVRNDTQESQEHSVGTTEAEMQLAKQKMEETKRTLVDTETKIADAKYEETKRRLKVDIGTREAEREALNAEFATLNQHSETRATLNVKREGVKGKEDFVKTHLEQQTEAHRRLVGMDPIPATMEQTVGRALTDKESEIVAAEKKKSVADRKLTSVEALVTSDKDKIKEKQNEVRGIESTIKRILDEHDFEGSLADAVIESKDQIRNVTDLVEDAAAAPSLFKTVKKTLGKRHVCLGCNRKVEEGREEAEVIRYIEHQLKDAERKRVESNLKDDLERWEDVLASLHRLQPEQQRADTVKSTTIPDLNATLAARQSDLEQAKIEAERAVENLNNLKSEQRDLLNLKGVAVTITRAHREAQTLAQDVVYLENQLAASGSVRTAKDVEVELVQIASDIKTLSTSLTKTTAESELLQKQLQQHRNGIHAKQLQISSLESRLQQSRVIEERLSENRRTLDELRKQIRVLDANIASADLPIRAASDEISAHRDRFANDKMLAEVTLQSHIESIHSLESANNAVEKWIESEGPKRLKKLDENVTKKENEVTDAKLAIQELEEVIRGIENEIHLADKNRKNMDDNIRHRQFKTKVEVARAEIQSLDIASARIARDSYEKKYAKSKKNEQELTQQHATLMGEISSLKVQSKELKDTLTTEYKNIKTDFMSKLIEVKSSDLANVDLEKYGKALDSAIMQYHSVKMAEINDILRHLWNRTYQGTDIDSIVIKSDSDEPKTSTSTRRNYNYRVVMTKDQVEMDMRGRCSAGQKVLASIIIRLALSESFGHNCGIIALDEPTTNLDRENIKSLATALVNIIDERKDSGHFQLIVITHDEEFLRELSGADGLDYYMRISRDHQQKSVISKYRIGSLV